VQNTTERPSDTLDLHIYNGAANTYTYYEDNGINFDYEKGVYYKRSISFDPVQKSVTFAKAEGCFISKFRHVRLVLHGFGEEADGYSFLRQISKFDPEKQAGDVEVNKVKVRVVAIEQGEMKISLK
jgi:alpha-glucosidase